MNAAPATHGRLSLYNKLYNKIALYIALQRTRFVPRRMLPVALHSAKHNAKMPARAIRDEVPEPVSLLLLNSYWLFDVGEGTQVQLQRCFVAPGRIDRFFPGGLDLRPGPDGCWELLTAAFGESGSVTVRAAPASKRGRLKPELVLPLLQRNRQALSDEGGALADEWGVRDPRSVLKKVAALGSEEELVLPDGAVIRGSDAVGGTRRGRKIAVLGDCCDASPCSGIAAGCDLLVHEARRARSAAHALLAALPARRRRHDARHRRRRRRRGGAASGASGGGARHARPADLAARPHQGDAARQPAVTRVRSCGRERDRNRAALQTPPDRVSDTRWSEPFGPFSVVTPEPHPPLHFRTVCSLPFFFTF
ncbi:hypothetical protein EMIHUDRAFT_460218 [Emiliania huxleyi CCMP1516]|uniref:FAD/NAD(P)-binding domain-containing protein n=2 Tax=Emiliania huxleyi TaxID=2903 RepID=A0A0D3I0W9_EMIH1|nr:hypothetical protein EMIHUDRAFT_460218 [Emiliania huxleyi CCMP1516]EOD04904.1 hypothetical protein EMIHUDRAFT_460218 [Emiliania huxleyi CCMP1516]|eukprot:XP_005757333.1 hypothetical protein EMIHUDRAFT_460218 [Emiliania huxleyi CCMP1516]